MPQTIIGCFETRRQAELAVEHCVQEYGIERADIFIQAAEDENTSGTTIAGSDTESAPPTTGQRSDPALHGPIAVSVQVDEGKAKAVRTAFEDAGASNISVS